MSFQNDQLNLIEICIGLDPSSLIEKYHKDISGETSDSTEVADWQFSGPNSGDYNIALRRQIV
jgi:hypothetical protein